MTTEQDNVSLFVDQHKLLFADKLRFIKLNTITKLNAITKLNSEKQINRVMNKFISEINGLSRVNDSLTQLLEQLYNKLNETEITESKDKIKYLFIQELKDLGDVIEAKISLSAKSVSLRPSPKERSYDQVVKGDVKIDKIKNNSEYNHKITFHKIGKFLQYQTWDQKGTVQIAHLPIHPGNESNHPKNFYHAKEYIKNNPDKVTIINHKLNEDRDVILQNAKEWVVFFNGIPGFTPTTVMEIGYKKYVFVIKKAEINKNDKVVFYISTKEIRVDNKSDKIKKIPKGVYNNVRFDIDYGQSIAECNHNAPGTSTCWCPKNSVISAMNYATPGWIMTCAYLYCDPGWDNNNLGLCTRNNKCNWCDGDCWSDGIGSCWKHGSFMGIPYSPGIWQYQSYPLYNYGVVYLVIFVIVLEQMVIQAQLVRVFQVDMKPSWVLHVGTQAITLNLVVFLI